MVTTNISINKHNLQKQIKKEMRDSIIDIMKAIGIIAMIIGHCGAPEVIEDFIFSWHMPLFFLVSGYFFKPKSLGDSLRQNIRSLVIPYAISAIVLLSLLTNKSDLHNLFLSFFVGAGSHRVPFFGQYFVGAIWFLLALFWCRITINAILTKVLPVYSGGVIVVISIIATYLGTHINFPTNILQGLSAMLFYWIGIQFRLYKFFQIRLPFYIHLFGMSIVILSLYSGRDDTPMSIVRFIMDIIRLMF